MSEPDPFQEREWLDYAARVNADVVPKLRDSAVTISLAPKGKTDIKFAVELGLSIMMDKPIIVVVLPGVQVPAKLLMVADEIVEGSPTSPAMQRRVAEAIKRVTERQS